MEWEDALKISFGAGLGLLISVAQSWVASLRAKKRAEKLLKLQLPEIKRTVESFAGNNVISLTELPALSLLGTSELASLPGAVAANAHKLVAMLDKAERSRKIASGLLNNRTSPEFHVHAKVYAEYIEAARAPLDQLCSKYSYTADRKKRRSFLALLFAAGDLRRCRAI